jgi:hypothetical protein
MRYAWAIALSGVLSLAQPVMAAETADETVTRLMGQLKAGKTDIDFAVLRDAYVKSSGYDPYGRKTAAADMAWRRAQTCEDAVKILSSAENQVVLYGSPNIQPHMTMAVCLEKLGNQAQADHHRDVADGFLNEIAKTGDGKSIETAFKVISLSEEYAMLSALSLKMNGQSLMNKDGHSVDVFSTTKQSGDKVTVYFNIDPIFAKAPF